MTLLSIPIVRYTHRAVETWQGGTLISVTGETDKNGQHQWVNARRTSEGLVVLGSKTERYIAPEPRDRHQLLEQAYARRADDQPGGRRPAAPQGGSARAENRSAGLRRNHLRPTVTA